MHLITTVYTTVVRMRECVCEEGGGSNCGINWLGCFASMTCHLCACEGEGVAVLRHLIYDFLPYILL